ncbi:hypothetical protein L218DRAFT_870321, partial [Marasmius fiardii PR-910]
GLFVGIIGGLIRVLSIQALGKSFTFVVTGPSSSSRLIASGPYAFVRHPSYIAMYLLSSGLIVYHLSPGSWIRGSGILDNGLCMVLVGLWIALVNIENVIVTLRIPEEEKELKRGYGNEWEEWSKVVKYRMIPGLY